MVFSPQIQFANSEGSNRIPWFGSMSRLAQVDLLGFEELFSSSEISRYTHTRCSEPGHYMYATDVVSPMMLRIFLMYKSDCFKPLDVGHQDRKS